MLTTVQLMVYVLQEGDQHWLGTISHAVMTLETIFGTIPNIYGMGNFAKVCEVNNTECCIVLERGFIHIALQISSVIYIKYTA